MVDGTQFLLGVQTVFHVRSNLKNSPTSQKRFIPHQSNGKTEPKTTIFTNPETPVVCVLMRLSAFSQSSRSPRSFRILRGVKTNPVTNLFSGKEKLKYMIIT